MTRFTDETKGGLKVVVYNGWTTADWHSTQVDAAPSTFNWRDTAPRCGGADPAFLAKKSMWLWVRGRWLVGRRWVGWWGRPLRVVAGPRGSWWCDMTLA